MARQFVTFGRRKRQREQGRRCRLRKAAARNPFSARARGQGCHTATIRRAGGVRPPRRTPLTARAPWRRPRRGVERAVTALRRPRRWRRRRGARGTTWPGDVWISWMPALSLLIPARRLRRLLSPWDRGSTVGESRWALPKLRRRGCGSGVASLPLLLFCQVLLFFFLDVHYSNSGYLNAKN